MRNVMIGTIIALTGAIAAVFLIPIAINIALFFKLRSTIPPSPRTGPLAARDREVMHDSAATKSDYAVTENRRITAAGSSLLYTIPRVPLCERAR
jgi:hypothetical protein